MAERIARDMDSLATRDSILRITSADYVAAGGGRLSATDDSGVVVVRPYERTVLVTAATASGTVNVLLPDAGLVAGKIFTVDVTSAANSKNVVVKDVSGYITYSTMTTTADSITLYSNGLTWKILVATR